MIKKFVNIIICIIFFTLISNSLLSSELEKEVQNIETYFKFTISSKEEINTLTKIVSIDNVIGTEVYAYANQYELQELKELGYDIEILPHPGTLIIPKMAKTKEQIRDWDSYPTYGDYVDMMYQFGVDYPDICMVENIGYSVEGREILFAKISDSVDVEENEPEFMYTATMHGDETAGYILMLRLIDSLLTSYGLDDRITYLVDNTEIWINPLANPDGTYHGGNHTVYGAIRYNANGFDLNRNFPDPEDGPNPGGPWQPETIVMMDLADSHSFVHSANFHGGAEVVNYPWDTWPRLHADDEWYQVISHEYADTVHANAPSTYMDGFDDGITNGYAWYTINGGRQDYMNYFQACREVTIELSDVKLLPASQLPAHWEYNKRSFINYIDNVFYGIRGLVTDSLGNPLDAMITVVDHDFDSSQVFTDPDVGDYHRMIASGTYDILINSEGYVPQLTKNLAVTDYNIIIVNATLDEQSDIVTLTGTVTNGDSGEPIENASITLLNTSIDPVTTNMYGEYTIENILEDAYTFRVSADGYSYIKELFIVTEVNNVIDFELFIPYLINDFEYNNGRFTSNNPDGWQWGEPTAGGINAYSGVNVWGTRLTGNYLNNANWYLNSPEILIPNNSHLIFYHYHDFDVAYGTFYDGGNVKISTDGGSTFTLITPLGGYDGYISSFTPDEPGFGGTISDWEQVVFDLSNYSEQDAIIRWHFKSNNTRTDLGWYIDDVVITIEAGVDDYQYETPYKIVLYQNYPNPFSTCTTISFSAADLHGFSQIKIYNVKGQIVRNLECGESLSARAPMYRDYSIFWDGKDENGKKVSSGIYLYKLSSGNYRSEIKKMILLR